MPVPVGQLLGRPGLRPRFHRRVEGDESAAALRGDDSVRPVEDRLGHRWRRLDLLTGGNSQIPPVNQDLIGVLPHASRAGHHDSGRTVTSPASAESVQAARRPGNRARKAVAKSSPDTSRITCGCALTSPPSATTLARSSTASRCPASSRTVNSGHGVGTSHWPGRTAPSRSAAQSWAAS